MYLLSFTVGCILGLFLKVLYEKTTPVVVICITPHSSSYPAQKPPFNTAGETPSTHWYIHASWNVFRPELWPQHTQRVILFPAKQDESHLKARCLYATGIAVHKCVCTWMCWFICVHLSARIFVCWMWCTGQKIIIIIIIGINIFHFSDLHLCFNTHTHGSRFWCALSHKRAAQTCMHTSALQLLLSKPH